MNSKRFYFPSIFLPLSEVVLTPINIFEKFALFFYLEKVLKHFLQLFASSLNNSFKDFQYIFAGLAAKQFLLSCLCHFCGKNYPVLLQNSPF
jgi:hypothetical protein